MHSEIYAYTEKPGIIFSEEFPDDDENGSMVSLAQLYAQL